MFRIEFRKGGLPLVKTIVLSHAEQQFRFQEPQPTTLARRVSEKVVQENKAGTVALRP
jgi:hypothetical protein